MRAPRTSIGVILLAVLMFALIPTGYTLASDFTWRSSMYPIDWTPEFTDSAGRFLHDFSYAGYHMGERPVPETPLGPTVDVTQAPYLADNTGKASATAAIQRAIDAVGRSGGGTVYLPEGTYRITFEGSSGEDFAISIPYSNVVLKGAGVDKTFLFLDETYTRRKTMIRIQPIDRDFTPVGNVHPITADVDARTRVLPVSDVSDLAPGDWIVVDYDLTPEWIAQHNMEDGWDSSIPGPAFLRRVVEVDKANRTVTIDIPLRYPVFVRDNGRVYRVAVPLEEVGLADFSFGMHEHPAQTGWADADHSVQGTGAYDVHASRAIAFNYVVNSWVRDVATYKPEGNDYAHIHSIAFQIGPSRNLTFRRVSVENPQYRGGAGNGYPFEIGGQEGLYDNVRAINGRHNFTISGQRANGNVIYRGYISNPIGSLPADFHAYLSMANLIDNLTIDNDRFDAADRSKNAGVSGFPKHGVTTTQTVFWNNIGLAYRSDSQAIIRSLQYGWGYIIGTRGPAPNVFVFDGNPRTLPGDLREGDGMGHLLEPQSLYLDQLERRLKREGKEHLWEFVSADLLPLPVVPYE